jgi:chaperone modulatory protein CbpM
MAEEHEPHCWRFTGTQMRRARMALRLQSDLGINLAGVALALQLLDEIETLQMRLNVLDNW